MFADPATEWSETQSGSGPAKHINPFHNCLGFL